MTEKPQIEMADFFLRMLISLTLRVSKNTFFGLVFLPEANLEGRGVLELLEAAKNTSLRVLQMCGKL